MSARLRRSSRFLALSVLALLVGAGAVSHSSATVRAAAAANCAASTSSADLSAFFASAGSGLVGGDYSHAYPLSDGRTLWLVQDAFIGAPSTPTLSAADFVPNVALIQTGVCFQLRHGGSADEPRSFIGGDLETPLSHWFWPLGGDMGADGNLHVFVVEMNNPNGTGAATGATPVAVWQATIRVSDLSVIDFAPAVDAAAVPLYGFSVTSNASWTYLYANCYRQFVDPAVVGSFDLNCNLDVYVARLPKGRFDLAPSYWNGSGWGSSRSAAVPVHRAGVVADPLQVRTLPDGRFVAVAKLDDWFGSTMSLYTATAAEGPFSRYAQLAVAPKCAIDCTTYFATFTPFATASAMQVVLSSFTWDFADADAHPSWYRPMVLDVPYPQGIGAYWVDADGTIELKIGGRNDVPQDAVMVSLTVTATGATRGGYVTAWPCGSPRPLASNLNVLPDQAVANAVLAPFGADGRVCLWSSVGTQLLVDVNGWEDPAGQFRAITPARLLDTRPGQQTTDGLLAGGGVLRPNTVLELPVSGRGGVPLGAHIAALNVTAVGAQAAGYITIWPCDATPSTSNVNVHPNQTVSNLVVVGISPRGTVCARTSVAVHLIADAEGWFTEGGELEDVSPVRLFDSRPGAFTIDGLGRPGVALTSGHPVAIPVGGRTGITAPEATVLNITVVTPNKGGFLTVWPCGQPQPATSSVNFAAGRTRAALTLAPNGANGEVCAVLGGSGVVANLVVDVFDWFPTTARGYVPTTPWRALDTRL